MGQGIVVPQTRQLYSLGSKPHQASMQSVLDHSETCPCTKRLSWEADTGISGIMSVPKGGTTSQFPCTLCK